MTASAPASKQKLEKLTISSATMWLVPMMSFTRWSTCSMANFAISRRWSMGMAKNSELLPSTRIPSTPFSIRLLNSFSWLTRSRLPSSLNRVMAGVKYAAFIMRHPLFLLAGCARFNSVLRNHFPNLYYTKYRCCLTSCTV